MVVYTKRKHQIFTYFFSPISFSINAIIQAESSAREIHQTPLELTALRCVLDDEDDEDEDDENDDTLFGCRFVCLHAKARKPFRTLDVVIRIIYWPN